MSALCSGNNTVRAYHYVTVEVYIHFQCGQNDKIKLVHISSLIERIGILRCTDFDMAVRMFFNRLYRTQIKVLGIYQNINQVTLQKICHRFGQSANAKTHADAAFLHLVCQ